MAKLMMDKKEAETWDFYILLAFSIAFAVVLIPALVIGFFDVEFRGLYILVSVLIIPQMIGLWIATYQCWTDRKQIKQVYGDTE